MNQKKVVLIGGMGEGLGSDLARCFTSKNFQVIGLNRSSNSQAEKEIIQFTVDLSEQKQVEHAIDDIKQTYGVPDVFIHSQRS